MSQNYKKLETLVKELFPPGQPNLDLGLYGVIHAKSAETEVAVANMATSSEGTE